MESKGIVRQIDDLGRVLIPKELWKSKGLERKDSIKFWVKGGNIILKK